MKKPLHLGITGGIGSGKTTVCRLFEVLGIPVYYADDAAKRLMVEDTELRGRLVEIFGAATYLPDGSLHRTYLAGIVFDNAEKLAALNALVHPAVARDGARWQTAQTDVPYTLKEAALLFESGSHRTLDGVITVYAPEDVRLQRVRARDGSSDEQVRARMRKQLPESEKLERADYILYNDGKQALIPQVLALHRLLCERAAARPV